MCPVSPVPRHWMLQTKLQVASAGWFGIALRDSLSAHSRRPWLEIWVSLGIHIFLNLERDSKISLRQKLWPGITHSVLQLSALAIIVFHSIPFIFCPHHFEQLEFPIPKVHQKLASRRFQKSFYILFTFFWDLKCPKFVTVLWGLGHCGWRDMRRWLWNRRVRRGTANCALSPNQLIVNKCQHHPKCPRSKEALWSALHWTCNNCG